MTKHKKYRVANKARFTAFVAIMIIALAFIFSSVSVLSVLAGDIVMTKVDPRISLSEKAGRS